MVFTPYCIRKSRDMNEQVSAQFINPLTSNIMLKPLEQMVKDGVDNELIYTP